MPATKKRPKAKSVSKAKPPKDRLWSVQQMHRNRFLINIEIPTNNTEQWILLQSDIHFDNPKCDRVLLKRHLEEARERDAIVMRLGDQLDLMGGKYDPRRAKGLIREEYNRDSYLRDVMDDYARFHAPYADLIAFEGMGNHEESVEKATEFPILSDTCARLSHLSGHHVPSGGMVNWIRFRIMQNGSCAERTMWTHHGYGGGGPVTKDMIQSNRQGVYLESVDVVATGHTHDQWVMHQPTVRLNRQFDVEHRTRLHVKCGTYKDAWDDGNGGWEITKGHPPKPTGGMWLKITARRSGNDRQYDIDAQRAM